MRQWLTYQHYLMRHSTFAFQPLWWQWVLGYCLWHKDTARHADKMKRPWTYSPPLVKESDDLETTPTTGKSTRTE